MGGTPTSPDRTERQRGLALVMVLWVLVLLSVMAAGFLATTRTETRLVANLADQARAEALADAGVYRAILALLDEGNRWRADGTVYTLALPGGQVRVSIQDEIGKIDLNKAQPELLRSLFVSLGLDAQAADAVTDAIMDFRDADDLRRLNGAEDADYEAAGLAHGAKDAPFEAVAELRQVLGVDAALYGRAAPALTVYSEHANVDSATAPRAVLLALPGMDADAVDAVLEARRADAPDLDALLPEGAAQPVSRRQAGTVTVRAEARGGAVFVREAVVHMRGSDRRGARTGLPYSVLAWRQGTARVSSEPPSETPD